jgi:hypothetical protein
LDNKLHTELVFTPQGTANLNKEGSLESTSMEEWIKVLDIEVTLRPWPLLQERAYVESPVFQRHNQTSKKVTTREKEF